MLGKHLLLSQFSDANAQLPLLGNVGNTHVDTLALSWTCMAGILAAAAIVRPTLTADGPGGPLQAIAEGLYKFVQDLAKGQIGHDYKKFLPLIAGIFIFVLTANLIGILPWQAAEHVPGWFHMTNGHPFEAASPTTDFNVTFGLAILSLIVYLTAGLIKNGGHYLKELLTNPVEWLDLIIRPSTLALRLMLVITADEITRMVFLLMLPWIAPIFVMGFEIFIAVIQAFVFSLLTGIYIGMAVADHH